MGHCMCYRSKSMRTIERHLQQCINRIEDWALHNGFKFSKSKTQCVHFCQLRKVHDDPELYLFGSLIPVVEDFKFLGIIFDRKLSFLHHLLLKHHEISSSKTVIYCWIPSHIGIYGNEKVDKNAKESLNLDQTDFKIPFNNFKPIINKYIFNKWQSLWNETCFNKLKEIEPVVNHHRTVPKLSRRDEIILARLRIGHTRLTHSYLLKREEQPYCIGCDTPFTVRHFLLDCADFDRERRSLFQVKDLFKDVSVENILSFLKNVNLFNKI